MDYIEESMISTTSMTSTPSTISKSSSSTSETTNQIIHKSSAVLMKDLEIGMGNIFVIMFLLVTYFFIRT